MVTLVEGLQTLKSSCFAHSGLTELHLPASLKTIEGYAFSECNKLQSVSIAAGSQLSVVETAAF